jgi:hypothetical protein
MKRGLLLLLVVALPLSLAACPGGSSKTITGKIVAKRGANLVPVSDASVRIWPTTPNKKADKFDAEAVQNLRGVTTTRPSGAFEIGVLSSPVTFAEYPLLKGYTYTIEVEVPGYYITSSAFEFDGGSQYVEMEIEEKEIDVLDTSGGAQSDEKELQRGSVRKE